MPPLYHFLPVADYHLCAVLPEGFIRDIQSRPLAVTEFDEELWLAVVDKAMVKRDGSMSFRFKNGVEIG